MINQNILNQKKYLVYATVSIRNSDISQTTSKIPEWDI